MSRSRGDGRTSNGPSDGASSLSSVQTTLTYNSAQFLWEEIKAENIFISIVTSSVSIEWFLNYFFYNVTIRSDYRDLYLQ